MNNEDIFIANGILWSSCKGLYKEILMKLASSYNIEQVVIYNLKNSYANFIIGCYQHDEDVMSDGYIDEKINRLLQDDNTMIVAFTLAIANPQYRYSSKGILQCIQARMLKESVRKDFSNKIDNYFLDNIIHMADNSDESRILERLFNQYEKYAIKGCLFEEYDPRYALSLYKDDLHTSMDREDK